MTEWYIATLGELGKFQSGFAFKSRDWVQSGVPVVKIQNVRDGRVSLGSCAYVEPDVAQAAARHRLSRGDVLVTMSGEIGAVGVVSSDEHILLNQRVGRLILHEFDPDMLRYLGYALQHPDLKVRMEAMAYGAAQPNISPSLLSTLPIAIPDIAGQRAIGIALEAVDNLIDNFRRRAAVLEEMQQALYREWFTKFRFPGHETEPIVTSTLGQRPESWRVGQLSDVGGVTIGGDWGEDEPQSNDWIQVACLRGVDLPRLRMGSTSGVRTRWVKDKSLEKRQLSDRDVVVEGSGECGRALAITDRLLKLIERPAVYSNFCKRLRCRTPELLT